MAEMSIYIWIGVSLCDVPAFVKWRRRDAGDNGVRVWYGKRLCLWTPHNAGGPAFSVASPEDFLRDWTENILFVICGGSTAVLVPDSSALGESGGPYLDMHGAPRAYARGGDRCHWEVYIKELLAEVFTTWAYYDNLVEMESSLLKLTHSLDSGLLKKRKRAAPKQLFIEIWSNKSGANHFFLFILILFEVYFFFKVLSIAIC